MTQQWETLGCPEARSTQGQQEGTWGLAGLFCILIGVLVARLSKCIMKKNPKIYLALK